MAQFQSVVGGGLGRRSGKGPFSFRFCLCLCVCASTPVPVSVLSPGPHAVRVDSPIEVTQRARESEEEKKERGE